MSGVRRLQQTDGLTVFPLLVKAKMHSKTVDVNIKLKAQVMPGPSAEGKVIACALQFITEFDGAALLVLDPETKKWGSTMVMPHCSGLSGKSGQADGGRYCPVGSSIWHGQVHCSPAADCSPIQADGARAGHAGRHDDGSGRRAGS